ncbi:hypothetical protein ACFCV3_41750 [Kribbella sp. NPDC056345]|uniref:hypothetical protein n=1 Tax=Kribbella sp. NPDC056345 TaxID=3345789 RepID=UPI0035DCEEA1
MNPVPPAAAPAASPAEPGAASAPANPAEPTESTTTPPAVENPPPALRAVEKKPARKTSRPIMIVYMPRDLRDWLRKAAAGSTQLTVVLDAVEQAEQDGQLGRMVAAAEQPDTSGLFERPSSTKGSKAHIQVALSALPSHVDVLNQLTARHDAPDRSALIRAALTYARQHPRKHRA